MMNETVIHSVTVFMGNKSTYSQCCSVSTKTEIEVGHDGMRFMFSGAKIREFLLHLDGFVFLGRTVSGLRGDGLKNHEINKLKPGQVCIVSSSPSVN